MLEKRLGKIDFAEFGSMKDYYLKHYNKRVDYINDWWNVVNWDLVEQKYGCSCVSLRGK